MSKIKSLSLLYILFLIMLLLSGSLSGILSDAVYILSFILPSALGLYQLRREGSGEQDSLLSLDRSSLGLILLTAAPIIMMVIITSGITSNIIYILFGAKNSVDLGDNLLLAIIIHAFLPALLEELLFRYLPMRLYGGTANATMVVVSSLFFALVHRDLFVIPYAFLAGAIFMIINVIFRSIWPSVILHALNNTLSVLLIFFSAQPIVTYILYSSILILSVASIIFIIIRKKEYEERLKQAFSGEKVKLSIEVLYLAVPTLLMAVLNLMGKITG